MATFPIVGNAGAQTAIRATPRQVFEGHAVFGSFPGGVFIDGAKSRDSGNTGDLGVLRAGLLMGKVTTDDDWAPTILGVSTGAYTSGGTSITVSAAQATEIVRRVGSTGNLRYVGPPTAAGTVAVSGAIAYSAVNTTTGVITTADIGADKIAGTFVCANDGTHLPRSFIPDGWGIKVTDSSEASVAAVPWYLVPTAGNVVSSQILYWPSDTSLQSWIVDTLSTIGRTNFSFTIPGFRTS